MIKVAWPIGCYGSYVMQSIFAYSNLGRGKIAIDENGSPIPAVVNSGAGAERRLSHNQQNEEKLQQVTDRQKKSFFDGVKFF